MRRYLRDLALLVLVYYGAAHLGYALQFSGPVAAIVWLPVGVAIAFLYLRGMQFWPGVVIGDLLVNNYSTLPVGTAVAQSFGNLLEVLVATELLRRWSRRNDPTSTIVGVIGLIAALAAGTLLSAAIGSLSSWLGGVIAARSVPHVLRTWWLGDLSGALIVVPLALSWSSLPPRPWPRARVIEATLAIAAVTLLSALAFADEQLLRSIVFPALIWVAVRFGPRGATLAITTISAFALAAAIDRVGPFAVVSIDRILSTQLFITVVSISGLSVAALCSEKMRLTDSLRLSRARIMAASDEARRQLERDLHDGAQQSLVGVRLKLAQATDVIAEDPDEGARLLHAVERQLDGVIGSVRTLAHGIYPPVLQEYGVVEALRSMVRTSALPVSIGARDVGRYPHAVEVAVYFCCLEAIQNVVKHAGRDVEATVRLRRRGGRLVFEVNDAGCGFDMGQVGQGMGLASMRDRIEAVGGDLEVISAPGRGTTVRGLVPV
jgi:signal transduction histidine kinase